MIDVIVISDTHGRIDRIGKVLTLHPQIREIWFLGDGELDFLRTLSQYPEKNIKYVSGNCDFPNLCSLGKTHAESVFDFAGHRILMTHGHKYGVKSTMEQIKDRAFCLNVDIVLFGHTHKAYEHYEAEPYGVYYFNPGSLGLPVDGMPSYGILHFEGSSVLLSHGNIEI